MKNIFNLMLTLCVGVQANFMVAQATYEGNDISAPSGSFLGWDNSVSSPLRITHQAYLPILFSTDNTERMRIAEFGNVGVGTGASGLGPKFFSVLMNSNASSSTFENIAIKGHNRYFATEPQDHVGINGICDGDNDDEGMRNIAGWFVARNGDQSIGIESYVGAEPVSYYEAGRLGWGVRSTAIDHTESNVAVDGRAAPHPNHLTGFVVGIVGGVDGGGSNMYAGWFEGDVSVNGTVYSSSDVNLKENIEPLEDALNIINQLEPKTYEFSDEYQFMNFPDGLQYGLIAQDVETVLPGFVKNTSRPARLDSLGVEISPELSYKQMSYTNLIPILVAGIKEQQAVINAQNDLLAEVLDRLEAVENCCNSERSQSTPGNSGVLQEKMLNEKSIEGGNELYQNIPNPFRESTTINYLLEEGGRVQLSIYDKTGKVLTTLIDATQDRGHYNTVWNANGMPSGVYHYALYVNGELLVKRAIKLQE
jgi:hypothetical protein